MIILWILWILFLIVMLVYSIVPKPIGTIISNIAEPYFLEDQLSPLHISLTSDLSGQPGGLSYLKDNTDALNIQMVHDYYKDEYNMELPKDTEIVFGAGTTMMVAAIYYALSKRNQNITVSSHTPVYYILHKKISTVMKNVEWTDGPSDLTIIVSPNNPLGTITEPTYPSYLLYDVVYDKAMFSGKFETVNPEVYKAFQQNSKIFITTSFSKLGIPGVRCGFLITRDKEIAELCREYVDIVSVRYPTASITIGRQAYYKYFQKRSWQLKNYHILKKRRTQFLSVAKKHGIDILNTTDLVPFMYTNKSVEWWMKHFNVETRKGSDFNDTDKHSRFNLMISEDHWKEFMKRN